MVENIRQPGLMEVDISCIIWIILEIQYWNISAYNVFVVTAWFLWTNEDFHGIHDTHFPGEAFSPEPATLFGGVPWVTSTLIKGVYNFGNLW